MREAARASGGIRTLRPAALALVLFLALVPHGLASSGTALPEEGPDVPALTEPIAVVTVLDHEVYSYTAGFRGRDIDVPLGWDRVVMELTHEPLGDPWDRTFSASVAGVEVLRGTTPRAPMTVEKDITRYGALLPQGGLARVEAYTDTWVAASALTLKLRFYAEPVALVAPTDAVVNVQRFGGLCTGTSFTRTVDFGASAPSAATLELFLSGHGAEEFWFQNGGGARVVRVAVDGVEVGHATMLPYTYAFLGFAGADGTAGEQEVLIHQLAWWTAQQAADQAGAHANAGEIPPFRVALDAAALAQLTGTRSVTVSMDRVDVPTLCTWVTSASFLVDA
ncbi:MAG TPA: peptide-N4-asparagine amidase [Candidatus Thermoplasmatota archaeon]|nr:peptide-N4-asparagine amidase [Candidatus Thermoplasmatota archaeon]